MSSVPSTANGAGSHNRRSHHPPVAEAKFTVQAARLQPPSYPFQPLPPANGPAPYRMDLSQILLPQAYQAVETSKVMNFHSVGDTGDYRGQQQDFVAEMLVNDAQAIGGFGPAFFYHLGDVVYFAGDVDMYNANFYETYKDYPSFIVGITGNHDCVPDDSSDRPGNTEYSGKYPFDGWVVNFMSKNPALQGSPITGAGRSQMDLPNVYWTFTTPVATIIGLCSNVGETDAEVHPDQLAWFQSELKAADPNLPIIVAIHHPPFSGDTEHSGSSAAEQVVFDSFTATGRYASLVLSGHAHLYTRFTKTVVVNGKTLSIPCIVSGNGGYTKLGQMQAVNGQPPDPHKTLQVRPDLTMDCYDTKNFGFMRFSVDGNAKTITGTYLSAPYVAGQSTSGVVYETFVIDTTNFTVT